jgi:hypothetical protein
LRLLLRFFLRSILLQAFGRLRKIYQQGIVNKYYQFGNILLYNRTRILYLSAWLHMAMDLYIDSSNKRQQMC